MQVQRGPRLARAALAGAALLLATGALVPAAAATESAAPTDPDAVVIRVEWVGGYIRPGYELVRVPRVVIYADGRIVTEGARIEIYPAPLLPPVLIGRLSAAQLAEVMAAAREAGLASGEDRAYGPGLVADAPDTLFTVVTPDGVTRTSFGAFGIDQEWPDPEEAAARAAAQAFLDTLVLEPEAEPWTAVVPQAVRLLVNVYGDPDPDLPQPEVAWPGPTSLATGGEPIFPDDPLGGRCIVISGDELAATWPVLQAANEQTPFTSDGAAWRIVVRPLLPGEPETCTQG